MRTFQFYCLLLSALFLVGCAPAFGHDEHVLQTEFRPDSVAAMQFIPERTLTPVAAAPGKVQIGPRSGFKDDNVIRVRLFPVTQSQSFDPIRRSVGLKFLTLKNEKGLKVSLHPGGETKTWSTLKIDFVNKTVSSAKETVSFKGSVEIAPQDANSMTEVALPTDHARLVRTGFLKEGHHPAYRGSFAITSTHDATASDAQPRLSLVNFVPFETYLNSVVPSEIVAETASDEALKAQAIAARTYALRSIIGSRCVGKTDGCEDRGWDVDPSTNYQSYVGATAERDNVTKALDEVRHRVVTYNDGPILAMFYSSSGGHTSAAKKTICRPGRRGARQRCVTQVDGAYPYFVSKVDPYNGSVGRFGHGLGLPQVSAKRMAEKGFSAEAILGQYYVGTQVRELASSVK